MLLVDTSVWVDHFRRGNPALAERLRAGEVVCHPLVLAELGCVDFRQYDELMELLRALPLLGGATDAEAVGFARRHRLGGSGLGWVGIQLLAACALSGAVLWTRDRALSDLARQVLGPDGVHAGGARA